MPVLSDLMHMDAALSAKIALPLKLTGESVIHYEGSGREDHMLLYLQSGSLAYEQGGREYLQMHPRGVLFLPSGSCYTSHPVSPEGICGSFVRFALTDLHGKAVGLGARPEILFTDSSARFEDDFTELTRYSMQSHGRLKMLSLLARLLDELMEAAEQDAQGASVAPALQYMSRHLQKPVQLETLAALCCMSVRTFCRRFQEETGEPPIAYHRHLRLKKAQELLESGMYTVEQTAEAMGFVDAAHFSRAFSGHMGYSAGSVRPKGFIIYPKRRNETDEQGG